MIGRTNPGAVRAVLGGFDLERSCDRRCGSEVRRLMRRGAMGGAA
jgi:hypothetical protein